MANHELEPKPPRSALLQAARLCALPGVTIAKACERYGVGRSALQRVRKELGLGRPSLDDLLIAQLSRNGELRRGPLPRDYAGLASWFDYIDHDGCTPDEARARVRSLAERGLIAIEGDQWALRITWPSDAEPSG